MLNIVGAKIHPQFQSVACDNLKQLAGSYRICLVVGNMISSPQGV